MGYANLKDRKQHEADAARIRELEARLENERKESNADATGHVTIEKTSKTLKAQILISSVITAFGVISMAALPIAGAVLFVVGLAWFCAVKFAIWWHHG